MFEDSLYMPSIYKLLGCFLPIIMAGTINAQSLLNKTISIDVKKVSLSEVLKQIGKQGGFYFSYNSQLAPADSLVSLSVQNKSVRYVLDLLFNGKLQYKEASGYIILQQVPAPQNWYISGYITDCISGERLSNVSVYERAHLTGTVTDDKGYFRLALKEKTKYPATINISVSRVSYEDTSFQVATGYTTEITLSISPSGNTMTTIIVTPAVDRLRLTKWLISSKLKKQTANLRNFLSSKPFQVSLTPGLGTHGSFSTRIVNKFSFNILGGYSAGVNGVEIAGLYNIIKQDVKQLQIAGLFNIVGGQVTGVQIGGIHNNVLDSVKGLQIAGICNNVSGNLTGVQISGITGAIAGDMTGVAVSGIANLNKGSMDGLQIAGIYNRATRLKGLQIGMVNVADTADGYSIGLLNINKSGYHRLAIYTSDLAEINLSYKAGNKKLYCFITGSANLTKPKLFGAVYGIGNETTIHKKLSLISELSIQAYYTGDWEHIPSVTSITPSLAYKIHRSIHLFAGPSLSVGWDNFSSSKGYARIHPDHSSFSLGNNKAWFGWQAGILF